MVTQEHGGADEQVGYAPAEAEESARASRHHWDETSRDYLDEHGETLGTDRLVWGPEGLDEDGTHLLGPVDALVGARVLEVGCGAGQGARWARAAGALAVGVDSSFGMLTSAQAIDAAHRGDDRAPALLHADARAIPLTDGWADVAFSAYGALPFVADAAAVLGEVARVLVPGGRWVFSTSHPVRWGFPDVPGEGGLTATRSYFDRTPYAERDGDGTLVYAEHHRTVGDWVRLLVAAGFVIDDVVEPEWPAARPDGSAQPTWGGWSALRGALLPGTIIFVTHRAPSGPPVGGAVPPGPDGGRPAAPPDPSQPDRGRPTALTRAPQPDRGRPTAPRPPPDSTGDALPRSSGAQRGPRSPVAP